MEEVYKFRNLKEDEKVFTDMARRLVYDYYGHSGILLGRSLLVDKEPLEPIAFPNREYSKFLENTRKLIPEAKFLFMIRDPIATIWSMMQQKWGCSLTEAEPRVFSITEYIENWCACAELVLQYSTDPNSYICQFGRLGTTPQNESNQIFDFLKIRKGEPFQPRRTSKVEFGNEERELIIRATRPYLEALSTRGISDL
jgi:hypothetical protein